MRSRFLFALVAGLFVSGCGQAPSRPASCKPIPPFELTATISPDGSRLTIRCLPKISGTLTLETSISDAVTRPVHRAESAELHLDVPGRGPVYVTATFRRGTARFVKTIAVGETSPPPAPRGVLKKNSRGESILEFPAR